MSDRYQGGVIRAVPLAPTSSSASGIWTMEQQAKAQAAGDWPIPPVTVDPNFNQVSMLLGGEPANSLDYTAFSDASTNNFLITPIGNPYGTAFSPYNSTFSNYFNGSTDYLTTSSSQVIPTGDFTIEVFVYCTSLVATEQMIVSQASGITSGRTGLYLQGGYYQGQIGSSGDVTTTTAPTLNGWDYVVLRRSGSTFELYVNGTLAGSSTNANTPENTILSIGRNANWITSYYWNGYISNLKISNVAITVGSTPTSPLTSDANTRILTCQSNRFIDNSANAFAITVNGSTAISGFIPFTDTDTTTGSGYFDGSGDYLTTPSSANFDFGTGDFTIEFWMYPNGSQVAYAGFVVQGTDGTDPMWLVQLDNNGLKLRLTTWSSNILVSNTSIPLNKWTHVAIVRNGGGTNNCKMYFDGVVDVETTYTSDLGVTDYVVIGGGYAGGSRPGFKGNLSNVSIVKGTAVYTSAFTPPTAPLTAVANTQLLTLQDRAANQNFGFLDTTTQSIITANGNSTQGTFSPYSIPEQAWSNYFNGSSDYIQIDDNAAFDVGANNFTIELWMYTTNTSLALAIGQNNGSASSSSYDIRYDGTSVEGHCFSSGTDYSVSAAMSSNEWHHVAFVRNGTTLYLYIDGALADSSSSIGTATVTNGTSAVRIGVASTATPSYYFSGYISNARIVNGTAVYTSAFTPPTEPLTAISGTVLLTCQSRYFIENSSNGFPLEVNGNTSVQAFSPFAPTDAYDPAVNGGSGYFDGDDYLVVPNNTSLSFGTSDFTVETWIYPTAGGGERTFCSKGRTGASNGEYVCRQDGARVYFYYSTNGTSYTTLTSSEGIKLYSWNHIAITRASSVYYFWINGVAAGSGSLSANIANRSGDLGIAANNAGGDPTAGYMTDLRIVNGTAIYTSAFTPPTAPLTPTSATSLLCNFTNAGVWDSAARNDLETVANAQITTSQSKFGSGSYYFDGTGDYLVMKETPNYVFGTGDFTVEGWFYWTSLGTDFLFDFRPASTDGAYPSLYNDGSGLVYYANTAIQISATSVLSATTWHHIALCRSSGVTKLYVDGTQVGSSYTDSTNYLCGANRPVIGVAGTALGFPFQGYIDDFRITKGVARYTTNFTPAPYPFPVK